MVVCSNQEALCLSYCLNVVGKWKVLDYFVEMIWSGTFFDKIGTRGLSVGSVMQ